MLFNRAHIIPSPPEASEPYVNHHPYAVIAVEFTISNEHIRAAIITYHIKLKEWPTTAEEVTDFINQSLYENGIDSLWSSIYKTVDGEHAKELADKLFPSSVPFTTRNH